MVQNRLVTGNKLHAFDPLIFIERQVDIDIDVVQHASRGNFHGRGFDHVIRLAKLPSLAIGKLDFRKRVDRSGATGRARVYPAHQSLKLLSREVAGIAEMANGRIHLHGRHALTQQHFADHRRPTLQH